MTKKIHISLTLQELSYLEHIMWHFSDYMAMDDRPDHGLGILKGYRTMDDEEKRVIFFMAGKLRRSYKKHWLKQKDLKNG